MKDNLEDTRALNELSELQDNNEKTMVFDPITNESTESQEELYNDLVSNEDTVEFNKDEILEESQEESKKEIEEDKKDNIFGKIKNKWNSFNKKKKIIIIVISLIAILLIVGLIIILFPKKTNSGDNSNVENIVIEEDNYIYENGVLKLLNTSGSEVGEYECQNKDDKLCYVAYLSNDEDSFEVATNTYEDGSLIKSRAPIYNNRYAFIYDQSDTNNSTIFLYDMTDKKVIDEYNGVKAYSKVENKVILKNKNDEYGFFQINDSDIKELLGFHFTYLGINNNDGKKVVAKNDQGYILLTFDGQGLNKYMTNEIVDYNDKYIVTKNFGKYTLFDYEGNEKISNYDYLRIIDDNYVALVNDKLLYIKDVDNNKYNEEGIQLNNDKYIPINVFDKDNKLIRTDAAFSINLNNDIMNIDIDGNSKLLDLKEGIWSKNNQYYSYFDGKLYFYSDEAKTNLIGTYKCNNKIESFNENIKNCDVALSTNLSDTYDNPANESESRKTSLYFGKYVFIYDSKTLANDDNIEIKFYDLSQNKVNGTYSLIDAESSETYKFMEDSDTEIIAKSKSNDGYYGVIRIDKNGASVKHKFEYDRIERLSGYFYFEGKKDNKWSVISKDNSKEFKGKIMAIEKVNDKEYAIIQDEDDEVRLYPYEKNARPLSEKSFKYIVLFDDVYACLDDKNKLWLYNYDSVNSINENGIRLEYTDSYYILNPKPFKLSFKKDEVKVEVLVKNNKYEEDDTYPLNIGEND